jgi:hypothetical protein
VESIAVIVDLACCPTSATSDVVDAVNRASLTNSHAARQTGTYAQVAWLF